MRRRLRARGFTLVEIMIVVAIIALLAAIAVPSFLRARKRSQAVTVKNDLRLIDSAINQYALEFSRSGGTVTFDIITTYLKGSSRLAGSGGVDLFGNAYSRFEIGTVPAVSSNTMALLSDVCDNAYWSPFQP